MERGAGLGGAGCPPPCIRHREPARPNAVQWWLYLFVILQSSGSGVPSAARRREYQRLLLEQHPAGLGELEDFGRDLPAVAGDLVEGDRDAVPPAPGDGEPPSAAHPPPARGPPHPAG